MNRILRIRTLTLAILVLVTLTPFTQALAKTEVVELPIEILLYPKGEDFDKSKKFTSLGKFVAVKYHYDFGNGSSTYETFLSQSDYEKVASHFQVRLTKKGQEWTATGPNKWKASLTAVPLPFGEKPDFKDYSLVHNGKPYLTTGCLNDLLPVGAIEAGYEGMFVTPNAKFFVKIGSR